MMQEAGNQGMKEMLVYCFIYPCMTMSIFMLWMYSTPLAGGDVGMTPFLVAIILLIAFVVDIVLILLLRKRLQRFQNKIKSIVIAFLVYELVIWILGAFGEFVFFEIFKKPLLINVEGAISLSSIASLFVILGVVLLKEKIVSRDLS